MGTRYRRSPATVLFLLGAVLATAGGLPAAAKPGARIPERFRQLGANGDGKVSAEEAAPHPGVKRLLEIGDADRDGALSSDEYRAVAGRLGDRVGQTPAPAGPLPSAAVPRPVPEGFSIDDVPLTLPGAGFSDPENAMAGGTGRNLGATGRTAKDGSIWVLSRGTDPDARITRRIDEGAASGIQTARYEAESMLGAEEVFVYYERRAPETGRGELRRCRTGYG